MNIQNDSKQVGPLLTVEEVAARLHVVPKTVRKLCASRSITVVKLGRSYRIPEDALDNYIRAHVIDRV